MVMDVRFPFRGCGVPPRHFFRVALFRSCFFQNRTKKPESKNAPSAFCCSALQNIANNELLIQNVHGLLTQTIETFRISKLKAYTQEMLLNASAFRNISIRPTGHPLPPFQYRTDAGKSQFPTYIRKQPGSCACTGSPIQPTLYYRPNPFRCQAAGAGGRVPMSGEDQPKRACFTPERGKVGKEKASAFPAKVDA